MNPYANAGSNGSSLNAYSSAQPEASVRETEARALLSCAGKLEAARLPGVSRQDYDDAIRHNQKLWTIFQVCLCEPDNQLPNDLKLLLLNISRYVDKASFRALRRYEPDLLKGLISINRNIAAGLAVKQETDKQASADVAVPPMPQTASVMTSA